MAGYLLDTNVVTDAFRPQPNPQIAQWMNDHADQDLFISAIVLGEIWQGIALSADGRRKRALLDWFDGPTVRSGFSPAAFSPSDARRRLNGAS
jgi:toxin FitB